VWVTLGEHLSGPELASRAADVCWTLTGVRPPVTDPTLAGAELGRALGERRMLLVIDDAWSAVQLEPLLNAGPRVTRLVTTRRTSTLPPGTRCVEVDAMTPAEAAALLQAGLQRVPDPVAAAALAATGRWPVLLALVNGAARADHAAGQDAVQAITQITAALTVDGPTALDIADPDRRDAAVEATLGASLTRLAPADMPRCPDRPH
jgi:hypothetical protein